ncbi:DUF1501 domain-containing protein [Gimesia algae]|uniref:DUF1501 domain-containing protein n=1 Tax=Gimesia algae TaxID=2527971 RepID=A0A517VAH9_9PLAN|nr:DUF1501 domain-containing protein [Gimesia algae]QDT89996.1 hypothetical protein Pan161_16290 [Gimesia algae]
MLTIESGKQHRFCDGISRRNFLQIGSLAMGGLSLPQILRAQDLSGKRDSHKSVIMIFLSGGPPHQDWFDLKPEAPAEIRGPRVPIATNVPGLEVCELMPQLANMADKFSFIRSIVGAEGRHASFQCMTGRKTSRQPQGGWPSLGATVSKLQGGSDPAVPPFVGLSPKMRHYPWADAGQPGFLGVAHAPFKPSAEGKQDMILNAVNAERLDDRKSLLASLDSMRRQAEVIEEMQGIDAYTKQAFGILTSSKLAQALDLSKEDPKLRDRYGRGSTKPAGYGDAGPLLNDYFLMARRLVEVGVRCVTLAYGRWDWHGKPHGTIFEHEEEHFPMLDQGLTALMEDLQNRGMDKDVSIVVWGEFGRTPRISPKVGRDHWPKVSCAMLAGGGMQTGQVIGSTNRFAEHVESRPVGFNEVFATLYHNLGIDVNSATVTDLSGRPMYLVDEGQPIRELI